MNIHFVQCKYLSHHIYLIVGLFRLQVVSTNVGGVPEVLPSHLIHLSEPSADG